MNSINARDSIKTRDYSNPGDAGNSGDSVNTRDSVNTKVTRLCEELGGVLGSNKQTIAVAESCTGGLIAGAITEIPGSSDYFGYGVVSYANEAKMRLLGVNQETLERYGAVSPQTAVEMAEGVRRLAGADYGLSVTGIAGPGGGTETKPVGLVYVGFSRKDNNQSRNQGEAPMSLWSELRLKGTRREIREATVAAALAWALRNIS